MIEGARRASELSGSLTYESNTPCKHGHSTRNTKRGYCVECNRQAVKKYRKKVGYKTCPKYIADWKIKNPDKVRLYQKLRDRSKLAEKNIRKRAAMRLCTPPWLTDEHKAQMTAIYLHARDVTITCGERYEVDHIVPINGKDVCGLHVPWNLQILPMDINRSKQNKWKIA